VAPNTGNRDRTQSFLWTILRDPTERAISFFFFSRVSRKKQEPTDYNFQQFLLAKRHTKLAGDEINNTMRKKPANATSASSNNRRSRPVQHTIRDYYLEALSTERYAARPPSDVEASQKLVERSDPSLFANSILNDYNFIAVSERLEESAVVLMLLLDVPMADVLFLSAKGRGRNYDGGGLNGKCTYIWKSFVSHEMQRFFQSDQWKDQIRYDLALYQAANRSLDLTIDNVIGRSLFEMHLSKYRKAQQRAREICLHSAVFPCSESGVYTTPNATDCLWKDSGCGTDCLDQIATEMRLW
jgi:hypothetical protein